LLEREGRAVEGDHDVRARAGRLAIAGIILAA
jgi:hypothetical protein